MNPDDNMDLPLVSVIIPTYNSARTIERCLRSIKAQSYTKIEIIVVDNYSSDDTPHIAAEFAQVIQAGPERSAQVNVGVRVACGKYAYRVDSDFELDACLIETCVNQMEATGLDALVIPNRSVGSSYWARVRALERDTYLDDTLMIAARFWRREIFLELRGLDENLIACEDLDFHNRLLENGCQIGRLPGVAGEIHLGESDQLGAYARESFYYGPSILRYLRKNPRRGFRQSIPLRPSFLKHWKSFLHRPGLVPGLLILKITQTLFSLFGMLTESLGLSGDRGRLSIEVVIGLCFVVVSSLGLLVPLAALGFQANPATGVLSILVGCVIWQAAGNRIARKESVPRKKALLSTAVAYSPLFVVLLFCLSGDRARWGELNTYLPALLVAAWVGWLGYLAQIYPEGRAWSRLATGLVIVCALLFAALLSWRSILRLQSFLESGFNLAIYDQALWRTAESLRTGLNAAPLLFSSITGHSLLADTGAPILLFWIPLYWAGIGGPALLYICQWVAIAAIALILFNLGKPRIGAVPSALICLAFLGYVVTQRIGLGDFTPLSFGAPLILLAWYAYLHEQRIAYFLLCILALSCGIEMGLVVAMLGLGILLARPARRQDGWFTLALGLSWLYIGSMVLVPYFGGTAGEFFRPYLPPANTPALEYYISKVFSLQALAYGFKSMAPLVFLPIYGLAVWLLARRNHPDPEALQLSIELPFLLLALPRLFLNLSGQAPWYTSLSGGFELTTLPFLFAAALAALAALARLPSQAQPGRKPAGFAVSSFILVACLGTTLFFGTTLFKDLSTLRAGLHQQVGQAVIRQIPDGASVSAQNPLSVPLAHRFELSILPGRMPGGNDPDYILMDVFNPNRDPDPAQYQQALSQAMNNPAYRLELADNGYLLFKRGESGGFKDNLRLLALAPDPGKITFPSNVTLDQQVAFLGMDLSSTLVSANETFYLTTYWKCLSSVTRPYLSFIAYPGSRRFEDFVFGFYPPTEWNPGQVIRQVQAISLPNAPDGDQYELVTGMWFDTGEPVLTSAEQLLGKDIIRLASISAHSGHFKITPLTTTAGPERQP